MSSQWVDSVLLSIKTAAAAAATNSVPIKFQPTGSDATESAIRPLNSYQNTNVGVTNASTANEKSKHLMIPTPQISPMLLRASSATAHERRKNIYDPSSSESERIAHYMKPLKRQQSQQSIAINHKNIVLQPRKVEPTVDLIPLDIRTRSRDPGYLATVSTLSSAAKREWIPNTVGNKVWSSRKVARSASPIRDRGLQFSNSMNNQHPQIHSLGMGATMPHEYSSYITPQNNNPESVAVAATSSSSILDRLSVSELRDMLQAIPKHIRDALLMKDDDSSKTIIHGRSICDFCRKKTHQCVECSELDVTTIEKRGTMQPNRREEINDNTSIDVHSKLNQEQKPQKEKFLKRNNNNTRVSNNFALESNRIAGSPAMRVLEFSNDQQGQAHNDINVTKASSVLLEQDFGHSHSSFSPIPLSSAATVDISSNTTPVSTIKKGFEAPRRFSVTNAPTRKTNSRLAESVSSGISSDESVEIKAREKDSSVTMELSAPSSGRTKKENSPIKIAVDKKQLLGVGKESFFKFMERKKKPSTSYENEFNIDSENNEISKKPIPSAPSKDAENVEQSVLSVEIPSPLPPLPGDSTSKISVQQHANDHCSSLNLTDWRDEGAFLSTHETATKHSEPGMTNLAESQRLKSWLQSIGMGCYSDVLFQCGISKLSVMELLRKRDLINMGIPDDHGSHILEKINEFSNRTRSFSEQALHVEHLRNTNAPSAQAHSPVKKGNKAADLENNSMQVNGNVEPDLYRVNKASFPTPNSVSSTLSHSLSESSQSPFHSPQEPSDGGPLSPDGIHPSLLTASSSLCKELVNVFDGGDYEGFIDSWRRATSQMPLDCRKLQNQRPALFEARLAVEFHLHIYFAVHPIVHHLDNEKILSGKKHLVRYLQYLAGKSSPSRQESNDETHLFLQPTHPTSFMRSREFATYASLAIVPDPENNVALQDLFKPQWAKALRKSLFDFLHSVGLAIDEKRVSKPANFFETALVENYTTNIENTAQESNRDEFTIFGNNPNPLGPQKENSIGTKDSADDPNVTQSTDDLAEGSNHMKTRPFESFSSSVDIIVGIDTTANFNGTAQSQFYSKDSEIYSKQPNSGIGNENDFRNDNGSNRLRIGGDDTNNAKTTSPTMTNKAYDKPSKYGEVYPEVGNDESSIISRKKEKKNISDSNDYGRNHIQHQKISAKHNSIGDSPSVFQPNIQSIGKPIIEYEPQRVLVHKDVDDQSSISQLTDDSISAEAISVEKSGKAHTNVSQPSSAVLTTGPTKIYQRLLDNNWSGIVKTQAVQNRSSIKVHLAAKASSSDFSHANTKEGNSNLVSQSQVPGGVTAISTSSESVKRKPKVTISAAKMQAQVSMYNKLLRQNGVALPQAVADVCASPDSTQSSSKSTPVGRVHDLETVRHIDVQRRRSSHPSPPPQIKQRNQIPPQPPSKYENPPHYDPKRMQQLPPTTAPSQQQSPVNNKVEEEKDDSITSYVSQYPVNIKSSCLLSVSPISRNDDADERHSIQSAETERLVQRKKSESKDRGYRSDSDSGAFFKANNKSNYSTSVNEHNGTQLYKPTIINNQFIQDERHNATDTGKMTISTTPSPETKQNSTEREVKSPPHSQVSPSMLSDTIVKELKLPVNIVSTPLPSNSHSKMGFGQAESLEFSLPSNRFNKKVPLQKRMMNDSSVSIGQLPSKSFNMKLSCNGAPVPDSHLNATFVPRKMEYVPKSNVFNPSNTNGVGHDLKYEEAEDNTLYHNDLFVQSISTDSGGNHTGEI